MKSLYTAFLIAFFSFLITENIARAGVIGNDTTITAMTNAPLINGAQNYSVSVVFPDTFYKYEQIIMHYSTSMPTAGWDPYDRIGQFIATKNNQTVEIGRFMTPFSKACSWTIDVTDFRSMLAGSVTLNTFILYYVTAGSQKGYLITVSFDFIGGTPKKEAYKIENLWGNDVNNRWEYGCYKHKISGYIPPKQVTIDPNADSIKANVNCTGHGEFNTDNCGEFCSKTHTLRVDSSAASTFSHTLWRGDCGSNPCSPQNGTWQYNRAGWCPGSDVKSWKTDITAYAKGKNQIWLEYWPQQYHNFCSPDDSTCGSNPASSCNPFYQQYGSACGYTNGHTQPFFLFQSQIIYYKNLSFATGVNDFLRPLHFSVYPNPSSDGTFTVDLTFVKNDEIKISVQDIFGRTIYEQENISAQSKIEVDINDKTNGIYLVKVKSTGSEGIQKIMIEK